MSDIVTLVRKDVYVGEQLKIPKGCGAISLLCHAVCTPIDVGQTLQEFTNEEGYFNDRKHPIIVQIQSLSETSQTDLSEQGED